MRVPEVYRRCVCFLLVKVTDEKGEYDHFIGTGFFVQYWDGACHYRYLVTARHVLERVFKRGYTQIYIRLNKSEGGSVIMPIPDEWVYPENPAIDIAILPYPPYDSRFEELAIQVTNFALRAMVEKMGIGIGDELLIVGLFSQHEGERRNIPIVRAGIIAAMPEEPFVETIKTKGKPKKKQFNAYLAEARSIGGLSGSPVFAVLEPGRKKLEPDEDSYKAVAKWNIWLLGVVRGHWNLKRRDAARDSLEDDLEAEEVERFNTGIALVTPSQDVYNLIMGEKLVKQREKIAEEMRERRPLELDTDLPLRQPDSEGVTSEEFDEALGRDSRKTSSQPESESGET